MPGGELEEVVGDALETFRAAAAAAAQRTPANRVCFVHCVSADLALGAGVALQVRQAGWAASLPTGPVRGTHVIQTTAVGVPGDAQVFHLVTKEQRRDKPPLSAVATALQRLAQALQQRGGAWTVVMPRIGCGLDGLRWDGAQGVRAAVVAHLCPVASRVVVVRRAVVAGGRGRALRAPPESRAGGEGAGAARSRARSGRERSRSGSARCASAAPSVTVEEAEDAVAGPPPTREAAAAAGPAGQRATGGRAPGRARKWEVREVRRVVRDHTRALAPRRCARARRSALPGDLPAARSPPVSPRRRVQVGGTPAPGVEVSDDAADEAEEVPVRERLRDAVLHAQLRAGRGPALARLAVAIVTAGMARTLRRERQRLAARRAGLTLRPLRIPVAAPSAESAAAALGLLYGADVQEAARTPPALPSEPPAAEDETVLADAAELPRARAAWQELRQRQEREPFVAGVRSEVAFKWQQELPPAPAGHVWAWGPMGDPHQDVALGPLLAKEVRQQAIELCGWAGADVVTPVHVARHPVTGKPRLIHDLRVLCQRMASSTVDYDRVEDALLGGCVAVKMDILSAFRHLSLPESDRRRMAFTVGPYVFRWRVLPFGASQSPELFCRALEPVVQRLRERHRIRLVVYVDDVLVLADSVAELDAAAATVMRELTADGWSLALDKCFVRGAARVIPFLGLLVDLSNAGGACVRVSQAKATKLAALCASLLARGGGRDHARSVVSLRELQKLGGTLSFLSTAVPDIALMRCGINAATAEAERLPGRTVAVRGRLREELEYWAAEAHRLPDVRPVAPGREATCIATDAAGVPALGFGGVAWLGRRETPPIDAWLEARQPPHGEDEAAAVFGTLKLGTLATGARPPASATLEVAAFVATLRWLATHRPEWVRNRKLFWYCDAQSAVHAVLRWRAKSPGLAQQVRRLLALTRRLNCSVHPAWVRRDLGWQPVSDFLSREAYRAATAEWRLPVSVFQEAVRALGWQPEIDLFATPENAQCARFCSQFPLRAPGDQVGYCNAFARDWSAIRGWGFPPFSQIRRCWRQLLASRGARVMLVLPRDEGVPPSLVEFAAFDVPPCTRLLDVRGRVPPAPFSRPLVVRDIGSPAAPAAGAAQPSSGPSR